ncbi:zinc finger protein 142 [Gadus morhua]|uniref:zinc finger protein 142 n=1 Tax=Gadus morhua TaxID=8049 RepID=UPI0011B54955|nr:zinc finger protein 142 [Gadus morhua]
MEANPTEKGGKRLSDPEDQQGLSSLERGPSLTSGRPRRKRRPNPLYVQSTDEQETAEPEVVGHKTKRRKKDQGENKKTALNESDTPPAKEYLAEGSEHIFRTHTCPKCRRCFKMRSHLQEHLRIHFPSPSLQCPTCDRFFTSKSKLRVHMLREAGQKVHHCKRCDYSAVERNALRRHLSNVHGDDAGDAECVAGDLPTPNVLTYPCPTCGQTFQQSRSLKAHMKTHNVPPDRQSLPCFQEGCAFRGSVRKELLRHAREAHAVEAVECRHHACNAIFANKRDMEEHRRAHLAYHCALCDFSCSNKSVFLQHRRQGHAGEEELRCEFCTFVTFNPVEFQQHVGHLHASEKIHRCPQCSYVTAHKRGLNRHMLMHSGEKPHKCSVCDFRCRDESYLTKHMLTHSDDKNFMCSECGYVTKWKHYLNVHMRKHTGDLRYECDQCPYRCHRIDQLNSHKLRHQAKSLMCEICAYACKRKYELRNHMLTKHSAGPKQAAAAYQCKYCAYTTCYRQALQNHENCKHTKLKEFRCALCSYVSFSTISLFLHKRKVHGYVPGDKDWLENYALKEKERNALECVQDFYLKSPAGCNRSEPSAREVATTPLTNENQSGPTGQTEGLDVGGIPADTSSRGCPEEYCTLVLTTLSTAEYETAPSSNEKEHVQYPNATTYTSTNDDGDTPPQQGGISPSYSPSVAEEEDDCHQGETDDDEGSINSELVEAGEVINKPSGSNAFSKSEIHLKAMKKHDSDQAEAMVMEGRVKMLVAQTGDVHRCDKCLYVTRKGSALKYHCQFVCQNRSKGHDCEGCGAHFKQRRGLDTHLVKKCPARQRNTRAFKGVSTTPMTLSPDCLRDEGGCKDIDEIDEHHVEVTRTRSTTQSKGGKIMISTSNVITSGKSKGPQKEHFKFKLVTKAVSDAKERNILSKKTVLYTKGRGKFTCKQCNFSSIRLATVKRHCTTCRPNSKRNDEDQSRLECADADSNSSLSKSEEDLGDKIDNDHTLKKSKKQLISCPKCTFKCSQKRALESHEKRGCMKANEIQCHLCSFVGKSQNSLTSHVSSVHEKNKPQRLHCEDCDFNCKQARCMAQHVAVKHKGSRPHRCPYCPFSTTRRHRLEEHRSLHTGVGRYSCEECSKTFGTVTKLGQHKTRVHDRKPSHFCSLCDFSGYTLDDVRRHNLRCHTGELQHSCAHCEACFSSSVALRNHSKRIHQDQNFLSCPECDFTFGTDAALKIHQRSTHPLLKCSTCQRRFNTKKSLETHQRSHLGHQCQLCSFASRTKQLLAQHLMEEHEEDEEEEGSRAEKPLKCSHCEFSCRHQLVLEQHLRSHGGTRLYKCTDCKYTTRNKQKITWHIRIHTGEKPYSCEQCSYTCSDPFRLKIHMRVHQPEKKYLCTECGYKCKWKTQLKYHMTKHTGEKAYACDDCAYRANRADALRAHRDTQHCDARSFVCEECGKAFKTRYILKTHQRQHSGARPYTCGACPKAFCWPAGLRHHFLSHTKQQPYRCLHCPYRAKQRFQVVKHLRRHHPGVAPEQGVVKDVEGAGLTLKDAMRGAVGGDGGGGEEGEAEDGRQGEADGQRREDIDGMVATDGDLTCFV